MGIIENRRKESARREIEKAERDIEKAERDRVWREIDDKARQSFLDAKKCLEQSNFIPLLKLLLPYGGTISTPEKFRIGEPREGKAGLSIVACLANTTIQKGDYDYSHVSAFYIKFYPDGKIIIEANPEGSAVISVSDLLKDKTLGEEVLEKAYLNPKVRDSKDFHSYSTEVPGG